MFIRTLLISLFLIGTAHAQDFALAIEEQMDVIQNITFKTAREMNSGSCVERYRKLHKDRVFNILLGFGYTDNTPRDTVYDWFMVNGFVRAILGPCRQGISACEFLRSKNDPDKYIKTIQDRDGQNVRVELMILRGSISGNHSQNISPRNIARQNAYCKQITDKFFIEMMKGPEIAIYGGHSRNGGGPDFCPPKVLQNGHVDYDWYERVHPGMTRMLDALARSTKDTQVLIMHSCKSISHFYRQVRAIKPQMAFLGSTKLLGMKPDFQNQYGGVDGILSLRCEKGLKASMNQGVGIDFLNLFTK